MEAKASLRLRCFQTGLKCRRSCIGSGDGTCDGCRNGVVALQVDWSILMSDLEVIVESSAISGRLAASRRHPLLMCPSGALAWAAGLPLASPPAKPIRTRTPSSHSSRSALGCSEIQRCRGAEVYRCTFICRLFEVEVSQTYIFSFRGLAVLSVVRRYLTGIPGSLWVQRPHHSECCNSAQWPPKAASRIVQGLYCACAATLSRLSCRPADRTVYRPDQPR